MEPTVSKLQRQVAALRVYCAVLTLALTTFIFIASAPQGKGDEIVRTKGIVIVDDHGRDRILIGAPVPVSGHRIRSGFERAKKAWGGRFPSFDWYKGLDNSSNGMIILDERGYDRIAIGAPVPDPNIGRRISPSMGIALNDSEGFERAGFGYFPENNRIVLGLDSPNGSEGVTMSILEDGSTGVSLMSGNERTYLGIAPANSMVTNQPEPLNGLLIMDSVGVRQKISGSERK